MLLCNTTTLSIRREKKQLTCCVTYVLHTERKRERERRVGSHVFHSSFFSCSYSPSLHLPSFTRSSSWDAWPESLPQLCCKCAPVRSAFSTSPVLFEFLVSPFFFSLSLSLPPKAHTHTQTDRHSIEKLKKAIPFFLVRVTLRVVLIEFSSVFSFRHLNSSHCHTFVEIFRPFGHTCGSLVHQVIETLDSTSIWENGIKNRIFT